LICNLRARQSGRIKPAVMVWIPAILLSITVLAYVLRNPLLSAVIEYYAAEQKVKISCLQVDTDWSLNLSFKQLCIATPSFNIELRDASWLRSENKLKIKQLDIQHLLTQNSDKPPATDSATLTSLPQNLPYIKIDQLQIRSPLLAETLTLNLTLQNAQKLRLGGDVTAELLLIDNKINAQITWSLLELSQLLPAANTFKQQNPTLLTDDVLKSANIISQINFDGVTLASEHQIDFSHTLALANCSLDATIKGKAKASLHNVMAEQKIEADLSAMELTFDLSQCASRPQLLSELKLDQFKLSLPKTLQIDVRQLQIPELQLSQISNLVGNEGQLQIYLFDLSYQFFQQLQASYQFTIKQALPKSVAVKGRVSMQGSGLISAKPAQNGQFSQSEWQLTHGKNQLSIDNVTAKQLTLESASMMFDLKGDNDSGLGLQGELKLEKLRFNELGLSQIHNQIKLNITPSLRILLALSAQATALNVAANNIETLQSQLNAEATLSLAPQTDWLNQLSDINITGHGEAKQIRSVDLSVANIATQFTLQGGQSSELRFTLAHQTTGLKIPTLRLPKVSSELSGSLIKWHSLTFVGQSNLTSSVLSVRDKKINIDPLTIKHVGHSDFTLKGTGSQHDITFGQGINAKLEQQNANVVIALPIQKVASLQGLIKQFAADLVFSQGMMNADISLNIPVNSQATKGVGKVELTNLGGHYGNTLFDGGSLSVPFTFSSAGLQLSESTLQLNSINAGIPVEMIQASLVAEASGLKLSKLNGRILGGEFSLQNIWLDQREQQFDLVLQDIDLEKVVALQNQPGIRISGKIMGRIPVATAATNVEVDDGRMVSQGGGKLTILHNPAFDTIKQQQPSLGFLENYQFSQLSSKVTFKPDGWLFLDLAFMGQNPDKKQSVNFNYSHQENIFALLRTLRVANGIQDKIEKNITQGGKQ
jgi:hypothetical protein